MQGWEVGVRACKSTSGVECAWSLARCLQPGRRGWVLRWNVLDMGDHASLSGH